jgi:hypothetical protein
MYYNLLIVIDIRYLVIFIVSFFVLYLYLAIQLLMQHTKLKNSSVV